jgi:hypothetical protein
MLSLMGDRGFAVLLLPLIGIVVTYEDAGFRGKGE